MDEMLRRRLMMQPRGGGRLPAEYQEVEWLKGNASSYPGTRIITNVTVTDDLDFEIKFQYYTESSYDQKIAGVSFVFGIAGSGSEWNTYSRLRTVGENWIMQDFLLKDGDIFIYKTEGHISYFNDNVIEENYRVASDKPFNIFNINARTGTGTDGSSTRSKIHYVILYRGGNEVGHFIPCYRKSDNKPGMYDLCGSICPLTGTPFYINAGTGEFTAGPDVN